MEQHVATPVALLRDVPRAQACHTDGAQRNHP